MSLSLDDLRECNEFLNALIDNINSAVFVVDEKIRIHEFNRGLRMLFGLSDEKALRELCGNAIGCGFAVTEKNRCGQTSHCSQCELRSAVSLARREKIPTIKQKLSREFYIGGMPILKHLELTTKHICFRGQEMILVIIDDVTESEIQKQAILEKQQRIEEDLRAAAGIQQSLLPRRLPRVENLEIAWRFQPCTYIGGDIFNVFRLDREHLGGYMVDVSGHGVPSALVTVSVAQALQPTPPFFEILPPVQVCTALDREYPLERFGTFLTMIYLVLNVTNGELVYTNAGHPPMVLLHRDGSIELLSEGGSIIGLDGMVPFWEARRQLEAGDRLVLYTDGVTEHRNGSGEFFGQKRLYDTLRACRSASVDGALTEVLNALEAFGDGMALRDDVSLLAIDYKG